MTKSFRAEFYDNAFLAHRAKISIGEVHAIRSALKRQHSQKVRRIWFSDTSHWPERLQHAHRKLRECISTQAGLFYWVYGYTNPMAEDALHVRPPSTEKQQLVDLILHDTQERYPWMSSRLIHAMAFAPRSFDNSTLKDDEKESWGKLYRKVAIPRRGGGNKRHLWIPNPPLKRIQKSLLRILGPGLTQQLQPHVYGIKRGSSASIFKNASAHCHSGLIINFDLKDFFPSTTISEVIRGIQFLSRECLPMVTRSHLPANLVPTLDQPSVGWSRDAGILVSRLATHLGRLPQGSPLSPLLANVAFSPFDAKLTAKLNEEFGAKHVVYTRYFDDITFSFRNSPLQANVVANRLEIQQACEVILGDVLRGSNYRLNERKTSNSAVQTGHKLTGLVVTPDSVSLPRKLTRDLRLLTNKLEYEGLVETAKRWQMRRNQPEPLWNSLTQGHRWETAGLRRRRISLEKMAVMMLRRTCKKPSAELLLRNWYPWQERYASTETEIKNKDVFKVFETLLSLLWKGHISVKLNADNTSALFTQDSQDVCKLFAESGLKFFQLPKKEALAVTEFWHHLRGINDYLNACPKDELFQPIIKWQTQLSLRLQALKIEAHDPPQTTGSTTQPAPETTESVIGRELKQLTDHYVEFCKNIQAKPDHNANELLNRLSNRVVSNIGEYHEWTASLAKILVERLPYLPQHNKNFFLKLTAEDFFEYLKIKFHQSKQHVRGKYVLVEKYEHSLTNATSNQFLKQQVTIIKALHRLFRQADLEREKYDKHSQWKESLLDNQPHLTPIQEKIRPTITAMLRLFHNLSAGDKATRLYLPTAASNLQDQVTRNDLETCSELAASQRAWKTLFSQAGHTFLSLKDSIDDEFFVTLSDEAKQEYKSRRNSNQDKRGFLLESYKKKFAERNKTKAVHLTLLKDMRNRKAHGEDPLRRSDWIKIQKKIKTILGRDWSPETSVAQPTSRSLTSPGDLSITGYEGAVAWLTILRSVVAFLQFIEESLNQDQSNIRT